MVDLMGSDMHNLTSRPPLKKEDLLWLKKHVDKNFADNSSAVCRSETAGISLYIFHKNKVRISTKMMRVWTKEHKRTCKTMKSTCFVCL